MRQKITAYFLYALCFVFIFSGNAFASTASCSAATSINNVSLYPGDSVVCPPFTVTLVNVENSGTYNLTMLNISRSALQPISNLSLQNGQNSTLSSPNYTLKIQVLRSGNFTGIDPDTGTTVSYVYSLLIINYSYIGPKLATSSPSTVPTTTYVPLPPTTPAPASITTNSSAATTGPPSPLVLWAIFIVVALIIGAGAYFVLKGNFSLR